MKGDRVKFLFQSFRLENPRVGGASPPLGILETVSESP